MKPQIKDAPELRHSMAWFAITSIALGILAITPFGFIFLLHRLNNVEYYLNPLLFYGICPAGGIGLVAIFRAEINIVKKQYPGKTTITMQIIFKTLAIMGIITAFAFMFLLYGYVVTTYLMS